MANPLAVFLRLLRKHTNLSFYIVLGAVLGVLSGLYLSKEFNSSVADLAVAFISAVKCVVVPLMFATLVTGIAGHGDDLLRIGRLALKTVIYFEFATTIALAVGVTMVNMLKPGVGVALENVNAASVKPKADRRTWNTEFGENLGHIFTESFFYSAAENSVLHVVGCAVIFGVAVVMVPNHHRRAMLELVDNLAHIMFKVTDIIMYMAPLAVAGALAKTVANVGPGVLLSLAKLVGTLYLSLLIYVAIVLVPILLVCKVPFLNAVRAMAKPLLIAFCTTSSEAALPKAMANLEGFGVPSNVVRFVLPTGYSFNLDGTTLYLAIASVFVAQASGQDPSIGEQLKMMLTLMLTSKGVAAVPRASFMILLSMVEPFHFNLAAVNIILGVDAFMDMARSVVNLGGNCVAAIAMAVWEREFDWDVAMGLKRPASDVVFEPQEDFCEKKSVVDVADKV